MYFEILHKVDRVLHCFTRIGNEIFQLSTTWPYKVQNNNKLQFQTFEKSKRDVAR